MKYVYNNKINKIILNDPTKFLSDCKKKKVFFSMRYVGYLRVGARSEHHPLSMVLRCMILSDDSLGLGHVTLMMVR